MPGNNALKITLEQTEDGAVLSTLTINYPSLENATANVLSFSLVDAVSATLASWSEGKAELIGEGELFKIASDFRKGKPTVPAGAKPPGAK